MDLYEIIFLIEYEPSEEDLENSDDSGEMKGFFHVLSENVVDAVEEGVDYLDGHLEDREWEIVSVQKMPDIHIVNYPDEDREDRPLVFRCAFCKEIIALPGNEWSEESCPKCGKKILRDRVISVGNNRWMMISVKEDKEC